MAKKKDTRWKHDDRRFLKIKPKTYRGLNIHKAEIGVRSLGAAIDDLLKKVKRRKK